MGWRDFLIGQWSFDWFHLQRKCCLSASSQKSALCWFSSTLRTLIQEQWHLWDFCNQQFCRQGSTAAMDKHAQLNTRIDQEFTAGWENMTIVDAQIHSQGQTPESVKALSPEEKRDWLGSVTVGWKGLQVTLRSDCARMQRLLWAHVLP